MVPLLHLSSATAAAVAAMILAAAAAAPEAAPLALALPDWYLKHRTHAHTRLPIDSADGCSQQNEGGGWNCSAVFTSAGARFASLGVPAYVRHSHTGGEVSHDEMARRHICPPLSEPRTCAHTHHRRCLLCLR